MGEREEQLQEELEAAGFQPEAAEEAAKGGLGLSTLDHMTIYEACEEFNDPLIAFLIEPQTERIKTTFGRS